jgi:hypothetical protein
MQAFVQVFDFGLFGTVLKGSLGTWRSLFSFIWISQYITSTRFTSLNDTLLNSAI